METRIIKLNCGHTIEIHTTSWNRDIDALEKYTTTNWGGICQECWTEQTVQRAGNGSELVNGFNPISDIGNSAYEFGKHIRTYNNQKEF